VRDIQSLDQRIGELPSLSLPYLEVPGSEKGKSMDFVKLRALQGNDAGLTA
jgi:hypothetical protein